VTLPTEAQNRPPVLSWVRRPDWLPTFIPELQGLRGLAILWVVLYHCSPRLKGTWLYPVAIWGWSGVIPFFVLSGFLITAILLVARDKPKYFHNFHARRALRIWPVYILLLIVVYLNAPWFIGPGIWDAIKTAPWLAYIFFVQNLFHITLPSALYPTWALAIEEQYYFVWAPLVKVLRRPWMLGTMLAAMLVTSPLIRHAHFHWVTSIHTLIHLDGIAWGSLLAVAIYRLRIPRRAWLVLGLCGIVSGFWAAGTIAGGTAYLDSALAIGFAGTVLAAIASTGTRSPLHIVLSKGPLAYYGKISYGLFMSHISVFIFFGWFDEKMDKAGYGVSGNLAIVAFRLVMATAAATALWYGFESQVLKLKKRF
jgi:peptidoglycan/LPS O-acetylase OafA/YrhL